MAVSRSAIDIRKPPSPAPSTASAPGLAMPKPMAEASPRPTDWKEWLRHEARALGTRRKRGTQPQKWPESEATARSFGRMASTALLSVRGSMKRGRGRVLVGRVVIVAVAMRCRVSALRQPARGPVARLSSSARMASRGHPGIGVDGVLDRHLVAELARLDVDLRHHGAGGDQLAALGGPVRQAGAEGEDEIALARSARPPPARRSRR